MPEQRSFETETIPSVQVISSALSPKYVLRPMSNGNEEQVKQSNQLGMSAKCDISEMISDPLLALFPSVADQPDMMDQLRNLWNAKLKTIKNASFYSHTVKFVKLLESCKIDLI